MGDIDGQHLPRPPWIAENITRLATSSVASFLRSKKTRSRNNHKSIDRFAQAGNVCENWKHLHSSWAAKQGSVEYSPADFSELEIKSHRHLGSDRSKYVRPPGRAAWGNSPESRKMSEKIPLSGSNEKKIWHW